MKNLIIVVIVLGGLLSWGCETDYPGEMYPEPNEKEEFRLKSGEIDEFNRSTGNISGKVFFAGSEIPVPGATDAETLAALMADELMIGVINSKTTAARLIPVPGKAAGEFVSFGGLFGESVIMKVRNAGKSARFVRFGGRIPAPIHSLKN